MTNQIAEQEIVTGKVTGIQPYGAFVEIAENKQGLVHISEVTHDFVKDINDHLTVGDEVKVKILSIDEEKNKISLSIRATEEAPKRQASKPKAKAAVSAASTDNDAGGFNLLKDELEAWLSQSADREKAFKK